MKQYRTGDLRYSSRRRRQSLATVERLDWRWLLSVTPAVAAVTDVAPVAVGATVNVTRSPAYEAEGAIAVDPTNPSRLFTASETDAGGILTAYSGDGGATWTTKVVANGNDALGRGDKNPQAAFDPFGNLYLSYLDTGAQRAVRVAISGDAGQTFSPLNSVVAAGLDQPSIAVGGDSAGGASTVWLTYRNGTGGISATGARITGKGASQVSSFSGAMSVPGAAGNFGDIAVGPAGEVVLTWQTNTGGEGPASILTSTDADGLGPGGFSAPVVAASTNVGGFDFLPAQPNRAIDAEANLAYDLSPGPRRGRLYVAYTTESADENNDFEIFLKTSLDNGSTWSAPVRVNDDATANSQFLPELAVDHTTGKLAVGWYDARDDAGVPGAGSLDAVPNNDVRYWGALSTDGGTSFLNFPVSAGVSSAAAAGNLNDFGDYTAVAAHAGRFHFGWADNSATLSDNPARPKMEWATASGAVSPLAGPRVRAVTPEGDMFSAVDHLDLSFDRPMDPATFSVSADVSSFTGPAGSIKPVLASPEWLDGNRTLRLSFPSQSTPGSYTLILDPDVRSVAGDPLDQDADGAAGESTGDRFTTSFTITPPRVTGHTPPSPKVGPTANFDFEFNQPMTPGSFALADDLVSFTGPGGVDLLPAVTGFSWSNGNRTLRVNFDRQGGDGAYAMRIGPNVLAAAAAGWAMDQDGDFTPGESADAYTATLTIDRSTGPDAFGYQAITHAFQPVDLTTSGSGVTTLLDDVDDGAAAVPLGSNTFSFYGRTYTGSNQLFVTSNGLITFGNGTGSLFQNDDLTSSPDRPTIAVLWDDWRTDAGSDSRVLYRFDDTDGAGGPDRLVIEWNSVPNAGGSSTNPGTFQALLQLNSGGTPGEIVFNYPDLEVGAVSVLNGAGATVGVKDDGPQGSRRLLVSQDFGTGPYVASGKAIRIATTPQPQQPPTVSSLSDSPDVVRSGGVVTLTAGGPLDIDGSIASVTFYRESNGTSGLQAGAGGDTLLGTDTSSAGGYTATSSSAGLADGNYVFYAVATDNSGAASNVVTATGRVDNTPPTVDIVDVTPDPRRDQLSSITVRFSEPVTGVDRADFTLTRNGGPNLIGTGQSVSTSDGGLTWTFGGLWSVTAMSADYVLTLNSSGTGITDIAGNALTGGATEAWKKQALVVGRRTFYNQSNFDRVNPAADTSDDIAVAVDKSALLPGQRAGFANITSYNRGINGIMIDVFGLIGTPGPSDFVFRVGNGGNPANWNPAPEPLSIVRRNADGEGDSDRITVIFPSGSIVNQWLQVTLKANSVTGLPANDVFYFGNLVGESGNTPDGAESAVVNALDVVAARNQTFSNSVLVTHRFDFNRDGKVNSNDVVLVRGNQAASLGLITAPATVSVAGTPTRRTVPSLRSQVLG